MMPEWNFKIKKAKLKHSKSNSLFGGNMQIRLGYRLEMMQFSLPHSLPVDLLIQSINIYEASTVH